MFGFIKKIFIGLLASVVNVSSHTNCVSLSNQKCTTQPAIINFYPDEYSQGLCCYPLAINLDVLEVVILLMFCLIKYLFQTKQKI